MRPVGYSTGALARGDFVAALAMLARRRAPVPWAVELSALRRHELGPLLSALGGLDLSPFSYVSIHAPSRFDPGEEADIAGRLLVAAAARGLPVILHPDTACDLSLWEPLGGELLIENMDLRKSTGQTAAHLQTFFARLPRAGLCLDVGHAWQVDSTLGEARAILTRFGDRLRQLHVSEVCQESQHHPLSANAVAAFQALSPLIAEDVPLILETPIAEDALLAEAARARQAIG